MTSKAEVASNIANAFKVVQKTYENIDKFLTDLDNAADKEDYFPLSPRFLRWRSDQSPAGWLIGSFIKVYQRKVDADQKNKTGLKDGPVYAVEVDLTGEAAPVIYLSKFEYDFQEHEWSRQIAVSEHWGFYYPVRQTSEDFRFANRGEYKISTPKSPKVVDTYWGLQQVVFTTLELVDIDSPEKIKSLLIEGLNQLADFQV